MYPWTDGFEGASDTGEVKERMGWEEKDTTKAKTPLITTRVLRPDRRELGLPLREFKADASRFTGIPLALLL